MLILFDIDGTLLRTNGAGMRAMEDAGKALFGSGFSYGDIATAGRLDTLIFSDLAQRNGVDDTPENHDRFRSAYRQLLHDRIGPGSNAEVHRMPGVAELITELSRLEDCTLGLLTGNYPETGRIKVAAAGLDPDVFIIGAWGGDAPTRRGLPPVAMRRHVERRQRAIEPRRVVIIGDTIHDVDCAKHNGCRALAVATGGDTYETLSETAPDLLMRDLSDTAAVLSWLDEIAAVVSE